MGRRRGERVLGPYDDRGRWRVIHVKADGTRDDRFFASEKLARKFAGILDEEIETVATTIGEALDAYERRMIAKGNKPKSYKETMRRLRRYFTDVDLPLGMLTAGTAKGYHRKLVDAGLSLDSHWNMMLEARSFLRWCVGEGWLTSNPLDGYKVEGKRKHGKPQLRIDEARKWTAKAYELAQAGEPGAVAALMTILLGLRASEVVLRDVRDLDDGGTVLWIPDTKTEAGRRTLEIPEQLQPLLRLVASQRAGEAPLFPGREGRGRGRGPRRDRGWVTDWVAEIAKLAGVPHVTSHGMRGLHASLAVDRGVTGRIVAEALGHESFATTTTSYASRESVERAKRKRALDVLDGGKKGG